MGLRRWLVAAVSATALAAAPVALGAQVVPPGGSLGGLDYRQWLGMWWGLVLASPGGGRDCQAVETGSGRVVVLFSDRKAATQTRSCTLRAGEPVYVDGPSIQCTSASYSGATEQALRRCTARAWATARNLTATVDGRPLAGVERYATASPLFAFHTPREPAVSAAYGVGFLVLGFAQGVHVVHWSGDVRDVHRDVTYRLTVTG